MPTMRARQSGLELRFGHAANLASPIDKLQAQLMPRYCAWDVITLVPLATKAVGFALSEPLIHLSNARAGRAGRQAIP